MDRRTTVLFTERILAYAQQYGHMSLVPLSRDEIRHYEEQNDQLLPTLEKTEERCPICLLDWEPEEVAYHTPFCTHTFHRECVQPWLADKHLCPLCRVPTKQTVGYQPFHPRAYFRVKEIARSLHLFPQHTTLYVTIFSPRTIAYQGFYADMFLPNNIEGKDLVRLLRKAFYRKLLLRQQGQKLCTNGIEMKRFPDVTFLARLRGDLHDAGVLE